MKIAGQDLSISSSGIVVEELDDNFDIIKVDRYGFTTKKGLEQENIILYKTKDFASDYARYNWMKNIILKSLTPTDADYQSLSYSRLTAMKRMLTSDYGVDGSHIVFEEKHIDDNPYIKGVGNALGVIITAVRN